MGAYSGANADKSCDGGVTDPGKEANETLQAAIQWSFTLLTQPKAVAAVARQSISPQLDVAFSLTLPQTQINVELAAPS